MAAHHGSSPAAWAVVVITLVGFVVGGIGMVLGPDWTVFWIGVALVPVALVVGKVLAAAGMGSDSR